MVQNALNLCWRGGKEVNVIQFWTSVSFSEGKEQITVFFTRRNGANGYGRRFIILNTNKQSTTSRSGPAITPQCSYKALHRACRIRNMWIMGAEDVLKQTAGNGLPYSLGQLGTAATATVASVANDEELWPLHFHTHKYDTVLVKFN